jgi:hypothetical protein
MKNIGTLFLVGFAVFGLFSFGVSGCEVTYFPEVDVQKVLVGIVTMKAESPSIVNVTALSPISLYFTAGGDAPKLVPHTVSAGILGEASQLLKGTEEADILAYYHVDFLEEKIYKTVSDGYYITATWNLGNGTVHFNVTMEDMEDE